MIAKFLNGIRSNFCLNIHLTLDCTVTYMEHLDTD